MNKQKLINELRKKYPGKTIICLPEENPSEIICELEPTSEHPERSTAVAIVGKSAPHKHKVCTEVYEVIKGVLNLYVDGEKHILKVGDKVTIKPGQVHSAEGNEAWFLTHGKPGWTPEDHIIVRQMPQIIQDVGFDFHWDVRKVWELDLPVEGMPVNELSWHFAVPFLWTKPDGYYDLTPQTVLDNPKQYKAEYERTMSVDMTYPIDIMLWEGRWVILDGLHRLMKAQIDGLGTVKVRKVDQKHIPQILKD